MLTVFRPANFHYVQTEQLRTDTVEMSGHKINTASLKQICICLFANGLMSDWNFIHLKLCFKHLENKDKIRGLYLKKILLKQCENNMRIVILALAK
jgi:hypothetical protein